MVRRRFWRVGMILDTHIWVWWMNRTKELTEEQLLFLDSLKLGC